MSDYRFGGDCRLNIYPKEAIDCWVEIDIDKVEAVEIEWVDFIRKPDDKSRWFQLFGTPERAARTLSEAKGLCNWCDVESCAGDGGECRIYAYDALLEWMRGDAE